MDAGLERLKVISSWEDGRRKRVPVSRCHRDKRIGECVCSISIHFKRVGVLNLRKSRFFFCFFFNDIECKKRRTRMMQPLCISKYPCITEEKGKLIK